MFSIFVKYQASIKLFLKKEKFISMENPAVSFYVTLCKEIRVKLFKGKDLQKEIGTKLMHAKISTLNVTSFTLLFLQCLHNSLLDIKNIALK